MPIRNLLVAKNESERNQGIALRGKDLLVRELRFTHAPR